MLQWLQDGGIIMWILLVISLISWLVIFERLFTIFIEHKICQKIDDTVNYKATNFNIDDYEENCSQIIQVLKTIFKNSDLKREDNSVLTKTKLREGSTKLHQGLTFLEITASIAPLLGLLGTVIGMVEVFSVIAKVGVGDPTFLSSGISKALNTTVLGLIVAIPALTAYSIFERKIENIIRIIEKNALTLLTDLYSK